MNTYSIYVRIETVQCGTLRVNAATAEAAVEAARVRFDALGVDAFDGFESTNVHATVVSVDSGEARDAPGAIEDIPMTVGAPIEFL